MWAPTSRSGTPDSSSRALFIIASHLLPDAQTKQGIPSMHFLAILYVSFATFGVPIAQPLFNSTWSSSWEVSYNGALS